MLSFFKKKKAKTKDKKVVSFLPGEKWHDENRVPSINQNDLISDSMNALLGSRSLGLK